MTLGRESGGSFDPATGTNSPTVTSYTFNGVEVPISRANDHGFDAGTLVSGKARLIIAEALAVEPQAGDSVTYGGTAIEVLGITRVNPAGTPVIYKIRGTL